MSETNKLNDSYLTKEAKKDIQDMLDIGNGGGGSDSGLFVVTEIVTSEEDTDAGTGDMTKAEILEAFSNGKIVVARITNSDSSFVMCGFVAVTNAGLMVGPLLDEAVTATMASTEADDCVTWTFSG